MFQGTFPTVVQWSATRVKRWTKHNCWWKGKPFKVMIPFARRMSARLAFVIMLNEFRRWYASLLLTLTLSFSYQPARNPLLSENHGLSRTIFPSSGCSDRVTSLFTATLWLGDVGKIRAFWVNGFSSRAAPDAICDLLFRASWASNTAAARPVPRHSCTLIIWQQFRTDVEILFLPREMPVWAFPLREDGITPWTTTTSASTSPKSSPAAPLSATDD